MCTILNINRPCPDSIAKISIAPMVHYSTHAMRHLWRQLSSDCLLYTEMRTAHSVIHGPCRQLLHYEAGQQPLALQLADNSPSRLALAARIGEDYGYSEINLNLGCPSRSAQQGNFGVCLLKQPDLVMRCISAMQQACQLPITVKTRLGVDQHDSFPRLLSFVTGLTSLGIAKLIIHARKAWLKGVNPHQNRTRPELKPQWVYDIKDAFPQLPMVINGGIRSLATIEEALMRVDGVMIGREAYQNPLFVQQIANRVYQHHNQLSRHELLACMLDYAERRYRDEGEHFRHTGRHLLHIYKGMAGANQYRQRLQAQLCRPQPPSLSQLEPYLPSD